MIDLLEGQTAFQALMVTLLTDAISARVEALADGRVRVRYYLGRTQESARALADLTGNVRNVLNAFPVRYTLQEARGQDAISVYVECNLAEVPNGREVVSMAWHDQEVANLLEGQKELRAERNLWESKADLWRMTAREKDQKIAGLEAQLAHAEHSNVVEAQAVRIRDLVSEIDAAHKSVVELTRINGDWMTRALQAESELAKAESDWQAARNDIQDEIHGLRLTVQEVKAEAYDLRKDLDAALDSR